MLCAEDEVPRVENQALKDEIARLRNLPPRPPVKSAKPPGLEQATQPVSGKGKHRRRDAKRDGGHANREVTVAVSPTWARASSANLASKAFDPIQIHRKKAGMAYRRLWSGG